MIVQQPVQNSIVTVGRNITLTCRASGLETLVYSWERNSGSAATMKLCCNVTPPIIIGTDTVPSTLIGNPSTPNSLRMCDS